MTLKVGQLAVELGLDDSKYKSGLKSAQKQGQSTGQDTGQGFSSGVETGAGDTGGKLSGLVGSMGPMLISGIAAIGAAAGVAMGLALVQAMEKEVAVDKLTAQLGASPQQAKEYGDIAGKLYGEAFGESIGDVTNAIKEVQQNGLLPEDATKAQIETMTRDVMTFADVLDQDLGMTTQAVGAMIRNGLAKDGKEALDILTRGVQQGADKAGDLLETFQEYSSLFRDLGIDAGTATGLLSQGLKAGARDADFVADALKEFAIRGQDASEASKKAFSDIGLNAEEMTAKVAAGGPQSAEALDQVLDRLRAMKDPVARNAAAVALFGTKAEDLGDALFALDPTTAVQGLGEVSGASEGLGDAYDNAKTKIESFKRQGLQKLSEFIGNVVIPAIEKLVNSKDFQEFANTAREAFQAVVDWVTRNWPMISTVIGVAVDLITMYWGYLISQIRIGIGVFTWFWHNVLSPVADFIVTKVVPVIVSLAQWLGAKLGPVVQAVARFWTGTLWPALQKVASFITGTVVPVVLRIASTFASVASTVARWVGNIVSVVLSIGGRIAGFVGSMWNGISNGIQWAAGIVRWAVDGVVGVVRGIGGRIGDVASALTSPFRSAFDSIRSLWNRTVGGFSFSIPDWIPGVGGKSFRIPSMHTGGVVPGGVGKEQLTVLLAGETVRTRSQEKQLQKTLRRTGAGARVALGTVSAEVAGGQLGQTGGHSTVVVLEQTNEFHGPVARDSVGWVAKQVESATRSGLLKPDLRTGARR